MQGQVYFNTWVEKNINNIKAKLGILFSLKQEFLNHTLLVGFHFHLPQSICRIFNIHNAISSTGHNDWSRTRKNTWDHFAICMSLILITVAWIAYHNKQQVKTLYNVIYKLSETSFSIISTNISLLHILMIQHESLISAMVETKILTHVRFSFAESEERENHRIQQVFFFPHSFFYAICSLESMRSLSGTSIYIAVVHSLSFVCKNVVRSFYLVRHFLRHLHFLHFFGHVHNEIILLLKIHTDIPSEFNKSSLVRSELYQFPLHR